ncbi:MAG: TlpA family protein disulfide reductase [Actinomycetota bacterium]
MKRSLFLLASAALLFGACGGSAPVTPPAEDVEAASMPSPKVEDPRSDAVRWEGPNFTVETFEGDRFELASQAGNPVVINFWESW